MRLTCPLPIAFFDNRTLPCRQERHDTLQGPKTDTLVVSWYAEIAIPYSEGISHLHYLTGRTVTEYLGDCHSQLIHGRTSC